MNRSAAGAILVTFALALFFALATYTFSDDHFGRISPARQILRYGELPFRDYFDPGYVLTELASAAVQRVFGDNLLGEMLLTSSFVAAGAVTILLLVRRAGGSWLLAMTTTTLAVLAFNRPYDYDKFLFYPLGLFASWRYADSRRTRDLVAMAIVAVVAGMFRYDNGIFVIAGALTVLVVTHLREGRVLIGRVGTFAAVTAVCALPYLLFLQLNGGVLEAVDQMTTYARREGARTRIAALPSGALSALQIARLPPPPPDRVQVRWAAAADSDRTALEARFTLHDGVVRGDPEDRTWLYEIEDTSSTNLRAIVSDPRVADTHLIDRAEFTLISEEPASRRWWRYVPFFGTRSISWSAGGAAAVVYYLFVVASLGAAAVAWRSPSLEPADRARVMSAAVVTLLAVVLILRDPVVARIGGVIGPPAVLGAWLWRRASRQRSARGIAAVLVIAIMAVATEWDVSAYRLGRNGLRLGSMLGEAATTSGMALLPKPRLAGLIDYVRRCTRPEDRVFAGWFVPELYFFSGRGFAGGMVVTFGDHWSEPGRQRQIIDKMDSESFPIAILVADGRSGFRDSYPLVDDYLRTRFAEAGSSAFGDPDGTLYALLTRRDRAPAGTDPRFSMPCFAGPA